MMDSDGWDRVKRIFDQVADLDPEERSARLDDACGEDPEVRREVEGLLAAHEKMGPFLDTPAMPLGDLTLPKPGSTVSHYLLGDLLGGGGMGYVFRATDVDLERDVAIKFLPPEWGRDPVAKARFLQEARAASALDHPNICTIFEVGQTDAGQLYIAMAYYAGETLKEKLTSGPLPLRKTLDSVVQAARGLEEAHAHGIVHRDIKPANLIVTEDDRVKVLDFGLAMFTGRRRLTQTGATLGTIAYMAPEALRNEALDHRVDIWSLGVVIYELMSGSLPFPGHHDQAIIYSILNDTPDELSLPERRAESDLNRLLSRSLAKDPEERYSDMEQMIAALEELRDTISPTMSFPAVTRPKPRWSRRAVSAIALALVVAALIAVGILARLARNGTESDGTSAATQVELRSELDRDLVPWLDGAPANEEAVRAFRQGVEYAYRRIPGGEKHHRMALEADPDFLGPRIWLVSSLVARGATEEARHHLAELESRYAAGTPFQRAMIDWAAALVAGDPVEEARHLEVASSLAPANRLTRYYLGVKRAGLGRFEEAYQVLDPLADAGWPFPTLYSTWSYVSIQTDRVEGVRERLESTALRLDRVSVSVYGVLEALCWWEGDERRAADYGSSFRREASRADSPTSFASMTPIYVKLAEISADRGETSKAVEMLQRAVDLDPENQRIRLDLAAVLAVSERVEEATALYGRARAVAEPDAETLFRLGRVAEALGRTEEAIRHHERYLERYPEGAWAIASRGSIRRLEKIRQPGLESEPIP